MSSVKLLAAASACVLVWGCAAQAKPPGGTFSVLEAARSEEGRLVAVRGYLVFGSHARHLWSSKHAFGRGKTSSCLTLVETGPYRETLTRNSNRIVILKGRVKRDVTTGFVDYGACNKVGLAIEAVHVPEAMPRE